MSIIGQETPSLNPLVPPGPPTMQNVDQQGEPQAPQGNDAGMATMANPSGTPYPSGAPMGDFLAAKGQTLSPDTKLNKFNAGANEAAQAKQASGTPPQPGDWARQLVAGAQSMFGDAGGPPPGGVQNIAKSLGDAAAVGTVPRGGGAFTGISRTLGARSQRMSEEETNAALHAETQARTLQLVKNIYRQDQQDRLSSYKQGADFMTGLESDRNVEKNVTQDDLTDRLKTDKNFMHDHIIKPIGEEQLFDANGKPLLGKDGKPQYSPLYGVAPIKGNSADDVHKLTASEAKFLSENQQGDFKEGQPLQTSRWNLLQTRAHANFDVDAAIDKANDGRLSDVNKQKVNDLIQNDTHIKSYMMQTHPGHPIWGLQDAQKQNSASLNAIDQQIAQLQQSKDPAAQQQIAALQAKRPPFVDEAEKIGKVLQLGFDAQANKNEQDFQEKQTSAAETERKDAETKRHNQADEFNKAEENRIKGKENELFNPPAAKGLQGKDYLDSLAKEDQNMIIATMEGRGGTPMMQNRKGERTPFAEAVWRAFPDTDRGKLENYPKVVKEYSAAGKTGQSLIAMGTAINHTRAAYDNTGVKSYIPGTQENNRYEQDVNFVSEELAKYVKGGVADKSGVDKIEKGIHSNNPNTRKSALENAATIIEGRRSELQQGWTNALPSPSYQPPMPNMSPEAQANFAYLKNGGQAVAAPTNPFRK